MRNKASLLSCVLLIGCGPSTVDVDLVKNKAHGVVTIRLWAASLERILPLISCLHFVCLPRQGPSFVLVLDE